MAVGLLGSASVTKTTTGTVTLTGSNGYTGVTTVSGGVLIVQNALGPGQHGQRHDGVGRRHAGRSRAASRLPARP